MVRNIRKRAVPGALLAMTSRYQKKDPFDGYCQTIVSDWVNMRYWSRAGRGDSHRGDSEAAPPVGAALARTV
jgi:hypothetical protein